MVIVFVYIYMFLTSCRGYLGLDEQAGLGHSGRSDERVLDWNKMKNKTTKILARSDHERAVWLRLFIPGTDLCQLAGTAVAATVPLCYGFLAPTRPRSREIHGKGASRWARGRYKASPTTHHAECPRESRWYIRKVHVDGDGMEMGEGAVQPSYPTRPLPISELPPRHRAVALPSQPRSRWVSQMDIGKRVPMPGKLGWLETDWFQEGKVRT